MNIKKPSALAPALKNVFGEDGDSDEEKAVPVRDQPIDASQADTIDKLAEYVARNGLHFEEITRLKNPYEASSPFRFLHEKSGHGYRRYQQLLQAHRKRLGTHDQQAPDLLKQGPPNLSSIAGVSGTAQPRKSRWSEGPSQSSSLEAMERYAKEMERREAERLLREDDEEVRRRKSSSVPVLNETGFDRRKVERIVTEDGKVGHHLQDFIPREQMAALLQRQNDPVSKAAAVVMEQKMAIPESNKGRKLLEKMGWKQGEGLGTAASGITAPVAASGTSGGQGLGAGAGADAASQDEFEAYRKRMQAGYQNRPNPLGNPRKSYY